MYTQYQFCEEYPVGSSVAGGTSAAEDVVAAVWRERPWLVRWLANWLGDPEDAADVFQETVLRALTRRPRWHDPVAFRGWLRRTAHNLAVDHVRSRASVRRLEKAWLQEQEVVSAGQDPQHEEPQSPVSPRCLQHAIAELPEPQRRLLTAVELGGRSISETARAERITSNNARVRLHRARRALGQRLAGCRAGGRCGDTACVACGCERGLAGGM